MNHFRHALAVVVHVKLIKKFMELMERRNVVKFLMKLNESYYPARRQILMLDPLPTLSKVYNLIAQEEHQRLSLPPLTDSPVFQATVTPFHKSRPPFPSPHNQRPRPVCAHCGLVGHTIARCYKIHGYPPNFNLSKSTSKPPLLPTPRFSPATKHPNPINVVTTTSGTLTTPVSPSVAATSTMAQAHALFEQFQHKLNDLGNSSMVSDFITPTNPSPGPFAGIDDWEG
ncbi:PREDICTED: uncharacterized protein LOC104826806 [Tarenaya hassleriana]|uniref:uncharacterized protein LOC104826806 n=1 Tax=Tarenaya hassleriana TaxID=28532 RepID=UPI00053C5AC5|nr:PREDICTED: uncharacterized protein LOC104826806 [Tarenaya hassleriana]